MLDIIRDLLLEKVDDIDTGNSKISEDQQLELLNCIRHFTDKTERLSKYKACEYLNVSRATFDNYVREGKLPKGKKVAGFNELSWTVKELDEYIEKYKNK